MRGLPLTERFDVPFYVQCSPTPFNFGQHQVVEQYKRHIFGGSGGQSLKEELMKLSRRVTERIPFSLGQDMTCAALAFNLVIFDCFCTDIALPRQVRGDASAY